MSDIYNPYFRPSEFECKCARKQCDAPPVDPKLIEKLVKLREKWNKPIIITSGLRCEYWNAKQGGSAQSQHLFGRAVDIRVKSQKEGDKLAALAEECGFDGIGRYKTKLIIHLDVRGIKARWTY